MTLVEAETSNRRSSYRVPCYLPCKVAPTPLPAGTWDKAPEFTVVDMSTAGCRLRPAVPLTPGRLVRIAAILENGFVLNVAGEVVRHHASTEELAITHPQTTAIRFHPPLDRDDEREVMRFIRAQERRMARGEGIVP